MNVLDLFSGIGGFSLGLERAGFKTIAFCEIDPFCRKVLKKHWPGVPIYEDIRELDGNKFKSIDVICGGFPCQPYSTAAAGRNPKDTVRNEFGRVIWQFLPRYIIAENTQRKAFDGFEDALKALGYEIYIKRIGAHEAGADHQRNRWWLCAYPHDKSQFPSKLNAEVEMLPKLCEGVWGAENYSRAIRVPNGIPDRTHRLKSLGNAAIPQIPEIIGRAIMECENDR